MEEKSALHLLDKKFSGIRQLFFSRMTLAIVLLIMNFLIMIGIYLRFQKYFLPYFGGSSLIAVIMVLFILNRPMEPSVRTAWIIVVVSMPVLGTFLYLFTSLNLGHRLMNRQIRRSISTSQTVFSTDSVGDPIPGNVDPGVRSLCGYLQSYGNRVYQNTNTVYFSSSEDMLEDMLIQLNKAEHSILMEYFIVSEGQMWGSILQILAEKAAQGVEVKVLYDGTAEFMLLPKDYPQKLKKLGISCKVFSPFSPFVSTHYNYRDHRKICVIDGGVAYTGGVNLADEYINIGCKFGHWKDAAIRLEGNGVEGFTRLFWEMWNLSKKHPVFTMQSQIPGVQNSGLTIPFGDNPLQEYKCGKQVYMNMINRATDSVKIMTPYLILDAEMENCLIFAAQRGVKVELIVPGVADKYVASCLAHTHYPTLLHNGIRIYEYSPGFIHSKVVLCDSREAVVGTINFDYRSFIHHFECGVYLYQTESIPQIDADFNETFSVCKLLTVEYGKDVVWHKRLFGFLLKGFSPLL